MPNTPDQQKWKEQFARRVLGLSKDKPIFRQKENGKVIFEFNIGSILNLDGGKLEIELGTLGLKINGELVGMGGFYYHPKIFGGGTVETVIHSWKWLIQRMRVDWTRFQELIEAESIITFLVTGFDIGLLPRILSLAVDLYELDLLGVDVSPKISELGTQARAHLRKYQKLKSNEKVQALSKIMRIRYYMANLSSECRFARFARKYGYEVKLGKHPDLVINGKNIEIKQVTPKFYRRRLHRIPLSDLSNPIQRGLKQKADIIAIQDLQLDKRYIRGLKVTWLGRDRLVSVLERALKFDGKCVLLFSGSNLGYFGRMILLKS